MFKPQLPKLDRVQDLSGYIPYTGATANVDLGAFGLTASYLSAPTIKPASDSVTAIQITKADGTNIMNFDTTNSRVGVGTMAPTDLLTVNGNARVTGTLKLADGSLTAGSIAHRADENTSLYFPANGIMAMVSDGVEKIRVDNNNVYLYDDTNMTGQYLTLTDGSATNGLVINNTGLTGDPVAFWQLSGVNKGSIGIRDSDADALYITGGATFGAKNIRLTSVDTGLHKTTAMVKASFMLSTGMLPTGATPKIGGGQIWLTANTGATNITDFQSGTNGEVIYLVGDDGGNTTITNTATIQLAGGASFTLGDGDTMMLVYIGAQTSWLELSRSNN